MRRLTSRVFREKKPPDACAVCGAKPVLRVVGHDGFCKKHAKEAWDEVALRRKDT